MALARILFLQCPATWRAILVARSLPRQQGDAQFAPYRAICRA